jgi:hypothetical protein
VVRAAIQARAPHQARTQPSCSPTYVASTTARPDPQSKNGSAAGCTGKIDLAALSTSVPEKLATGAPLKIMAPLWGTPPKPGCAYYKAGDAAAGTKITWQNQDGNTYSEKLGAVLASSSIPDMVVVPSWNMVGKISSAVPRSSWTSAPIWRATRSRSTRTWPRSPPMPGA